MENLNEDQIQHIRGVVESILFVNEHPVTLDQIKKVLDTINPSQIKKVIEDLMEDNKEQKRSMNIVEIAGGYQMLSNSLYASYLRKFYKTKHKQKLSKPSLETMAIVAYKQPVTRADIELIRGVNSDGIVATLLDKELIKVVGRKDVAGKPFLYGSTKLFLEYFGLKSLESLPKLEEFDALKPVYEQRAGESEILSEEERIPDDVVPMDSLEHAKQGAIALESNKISAVAVAEPRDEVQQEKSEYETE